MPKSINQIDLIDAIVRHLEKREGITDASPRIFNAIIAGANLIVAALGKDDVMSTPGMGVSRWRASDDTGMSSKYLLNLISQDSSGGAEYAHPHDAYDWGCCDRMLDACGLRERLGEIRGNHKTWDLLLDSWGEIKAAYDGENFVEASRLVQLAIQ